MKYLKNYKEKKIFENINQIMLSLTDNPNINWSFGYNHYGLIFNIWKKDSGKKIILDNIKWEINHLINYLISEGYKLKSNKLKNKLSKWIELESIELENPNTEILQFRIEFFG
jgi:hypothetical protein